MKLFFETAIQSWSFLMVLPLGFGLALLLDAGAVTRAFRCAADILLVLSAGVAVFSVVVWNGESDLRLFHLLGLLTGAMLYLCGAGRLWRMFFRRFMRNKQFKQDKQSPAEK